MKISVKMITATLGAAAVLTAGILGTVAFLSAEDTAVNTFTVGNIQMTLDETKVDTDGTYDSSNIVKTDSNAYHLIPGSTYTKDPTVHILPGSEASYVFIHVINDISEIEGGTTIESQILENGWIAVPDKEGYYYKTQDGTGEDATDNLIIFSHFTIADVDNATLANYAGDNITIKAFAIQQKNYTLTSAINEFPAEF